MVDIEGVYEKIEFISSINSLKFVYIIISNEFKFIGKECFQTEYEYMTL